MQVQINCYKLWREGLLPESPASLCCVTCHVSRDFKIVQLPSGRVARVCCGVYAVLQAQKAQEYYNKDLKRYQSYTNSFDDLKSLLSSNQNAQENDPLTAESLAECIQHIIASVFSEEERPVSIPKIAPPNADESDVAWCCYYLTKLQYAFAPNAEQSMTDRAVAHFAAEEDLTLLDAARCLYCAYSEGIENSYTDLFSKIYHLVEENALDKYNA
jgi:hypothetical protein